MTEHRLDGSHDLGEGRKYKDTKDTQSAPETLSFVALSLERGRPGERSVGADVRAVMREGRQGIAYISMLRSGKIRLQLNEPPKSRPAWAMARISTESSKTR